MELVQVRVRVQNQKQRIGEGGGYSRSGYGYTPKTDQKSFNPTIDFVNDLGNSVNKGPEVLLL